MRRRSQLGLGAWLVAACSEEMVPRAEVAEVCGEGGPVQILPLEREEVVAEFTGLNRFEERWLYVVKRFEYPILDVWEAEQGPSKYPPVALLDARVESIGRCGEDRRVVAHNVDSLLWRHSEDEPWIGGRRDTGEIFWFDPDGRWKPRLVAENAPGAVIIARGQELLVYRPGDAHDLLHVTLGDAIQTVTLATDVADVWPSVEYVEPDTPLPTSVLVLHDDYRLTAIDVATGRTTEVAHDVLGYSVEPPGHRLVVQIGDPDDADDPDADVPEEWVIDRTSGERWLVGGGDDPWSRSTLWSNVLSSQRQIEIPATSAVAASEGHQTRFMLFSERTWIVLDGLWTLLGATPEGRFAAVRSDRGGEDTPVSVFEVVDGELQEIARPFETDTQYNGFWSVECAVDPDDGSSTPPCDRYFYSLETLRLELLGRRQWTGIALPGDRWLDVELPANAPNALEPETRAKLWVIDGATGDRSLLDDHVPPNSAFLEPLELGPRGALETDELVYQVRETDTDRTGLWRARFE